MKPKGRLVEAKRREAKALPLTDRDMKAMMPFFVKGKSADEDHKCGACFMRIESDDSGTGACIVVKGSISMPAGTCNYWSPGKASKPEDKKEARMTKASAGYAEYRTRVNCAACMYYEPSKKPYCRLWQGTVAPGDCCMSFENPPGEVV